jgi:hypothetical protein
MARQDGWRFCNRNHGPWWTKVDEVVCSAGGDSNQGDVS